MLKKSYQVLYFGNPTTSPFPLELFDQVTKTEGILVPKIVRRESFIPFKPTRKNQGIEY
jgi:hypothetical protein